MATEIKQSAFANVFINKQNITDKHTTWIMETNFYIYQQGSNANNVTVKN